MSEHFTRGERAEMLQDLRDNLAQWLDACTLLQDWELDARLGMTIARVLTMEQEMEALSPRPDDQTAG